MSTRRRTYSLLSALSMGEVLYCGSVLSNKQLDADFTRVVNFSEEFILVLVSYPDGKNSYGSFVNHDIEFSGQHMYVMSSFRIIDKVYSNPIFLNGSYGENSNGYNTYIRYLSVSDFGITNNSGYKCDMIFLSIPRTDV